MQLTQIPSVITFSPTWIGLATKAAPIVWGEEKTREKDWLDGSVGSQYELWTLDQHKNQDVQFYKYCTVVRMNGCD